MTSGPISADDILRLETLRREALIAHDTEALEQLLADDLVFTHTSGRLDTKESLIKQVAAGVLKYQRIEHRDIAVLIFADTAIMTGATDMQVEARGELKRLSSRFSSVWAKRDSAPQMVLYHASLIRDA